MSTTDTFNASGTWTAPANVTGTAALVCIGNGGHGGVSTQGEGGGGGGAYVLKTFTPVASRGYTVTVAAGGTVGGETTLIDPIAVVTIALAAGGTSAGTRTGAAGGLAAASDGDTKFDGGTGGTSSNTNVGGGGGGGSGTGSANGTNGGAASTATGGAGGAGTGAGGNGGTFGGTVAGSNGTAPGGGGGGGATGGNRGTGAAGRVTITYSVATANILLLKRRKALIL